MTDKRIVLVAQVVHERLHDQDWVVVDCRFDLSDPAAGRRSYGQNHVPGAVFLDLDEDLAGPVTPDTGRHPLPDVESIAATLQALGIGNSSNVVVYDQDNGATAARAWWVLRWLGHTSVFLLDGGLSRWQELGLPLESTEVRRIPTRYHVCLQAGRILSTAELEASVGEIHSRKLLDARDRRRFLGEWEPIDPVAGHVPGSICLPFTDFLRQDGTWLPLNERRLLLENVLGPEKDIDWSVMCGSGVTACHLAISGIEAGYKEPRLYVGSWSEWIRSPDRPIGTGASPETGGQTADLK